MLKKNSIIIFLIVLALVAFLIYQQVKIPDGVTPQSDQTEIIAWLSLSTAIISLVTALIGLIQNILDRNKRDK